MSDVKLGIGFPGNLVGLHDRRELDDWLGAVVEAGYDYISAGDHILGVDPNGLSEARREQWRRHYPGIASGPYDHNVVFREPMVLLTYFSTKCDLDLATGILVLPQRQTAVVAKQTAEVDLLSGGRLRLGVGVGWNPPEYRGLGASFEHRQDMIEEQIVLLRKLWSEPIVDFTGKFHTVESSGIQALPTRQIPIWIGGDGPRSLDRIGRLADGWVPPGRVQPGDDAAQRLATIRGAAEAAGRDPESIGVEARIFVGQHPSAKEIKKFIDSWRPHGMTHLCVDTRLAAPDGSVEVHMGLMRRVSPDML